MIRALVGFFNYSLSVSLRSSKEKEFEQLMRGADFDHSPTKIPCPECREPLWLDEMLMWD